MHKAAIVIGRFQPAHNSHFRLFRAALERAEHLLIAIGSTNKASSARNPFNYAERVALIEAGLTEQERARVQFIPLQDLGSDKLWSAHLIRRASEAMLTQWGVTHEDSPLLVGHTKDDSSYYLKLFPNWDYAEIGNFEGLSATDLRNIFLQRCMHTAVGKDMFAKSLAGLMPAGSFELLRKWMDTPALPRLIEERRYIENYKAAWAKAPYAPTFVTVDAVITAGSRVLLVKRGGQPGNGLLALPGGFLDQGEVLMDAAIRELREETGFDLPKDELKSCLVSSQVFDAPGRSQLGRVITHAYHFDVTKLYQGRELPAVQAGDDAVGAGWHELGSIDIEGMHDDHAQILLTFGLLPLV